MAASSNLIMPKRSTNSVTATIPRKPGYRPIWRADPHSPSQPANLAYAAHPIDLLPPVMIKPSTARSSQVNRAPIAISAPVKSYSRNRVRVQIFSDQGETVCRDAQHWRVLECADLN